MNITEATKEEFLLFFAKDVSGISCRPYFEKWLNDTRFEKLTKASDRVLKERFDAMENYLKCIEKSVGEKNPKKARTLMLEADKYDALRGKYEKEYEKLTKELEKFYRKSGD